MRRRPILAATGLAAATLVATAGPAAAAPAPAAPAPVLSTTQTNLVALGYMAPSLTAAQLGPATITAVHAFQRERCLDDTGRATTTTLSQLIGQASLVQKALHRPATGVISTADRSALAAWQTAHRLRVTGRADAPTMASLKVVRIRPCGAPALQPLLAATATVPCAPGTINLGMATGYWAGRAVPIHVCAIPGLRSSSAESQPGSAYYIKGANGWAVVNARVSGAFYGLVQTARNSGQVLSANSSFRTMAHQRQLCRDDVGCRRGDYRFVLRPGWSTHQMGFAVDFAGSGTRGSSGCTTGRATQPSSATWAFLNRNGHRFGIQQYSFESWHWDATTGPNQC